MAIEYLRKKNSSLKDALKNTHVFLNMVIHDLRNPTNQINYSIKYTLDQIRSCMQVNEASNQALECEIEEIMERISELKQKLGSVDKTELIGNEVERCRDLTTSIL